MYIVLQWTCIIILSMSTYVSKPEGYIFKSEISRPKGHRLLFEGALTINDILGGGVSISFYIIKRQNILLCNMYKYVNSFKGIHFIYIIKPGSTIVK